MAIRGRSRLRGLQRDVKGAAEWALAWADYYDVPVQITSGKRSMRLQRKLRDRYERCVASGEFGKTDYCRWPANRPGQSAHNYALAWDSTTDPQYQSWWNQVRGLAGFSIPSNDHIHAEVPGWRNYI
jgi:hypothetical protein